MNTSSRPGSIRCHVRPGFALERREGGVERGGVGAGDVQLRAERRHLIHRRQRAQARRELGEARTADGPGDERLARDDFVRRALRQQTSSEDVAELVAALGLVHVVRADEHRDAAPGELVQLIPEIAAGLGIDSRGRLVQQQKLRLVQQARGKRQALLPAAGELARELLRAIDEPESLRARR